MTERLLLYIDLLGFSEIVKTRQHIMPDLFKILDRSNAHEHGDFKVIQFSDTLLVYNDTPANSARDKSYCAMYLSEFAQEIQYMLLGRSVFFRGLITYGQFIDTGGTPNQNYNNIRAFWGESLVKAYQTEKAIQAIGLFVDDTVHPYMNIFETQPYDEARKLWFVDTATTLRGKFHGTSKMFDYAKEDIITSGTESLLAYDFVYLKQLFRYAHDMSVPPNVRAKYLATWEIYRRKYPGLCSALEEADFTFEQLINIDWKPFTKKIGTPEGFFG